MGRKGTVSKGAIPKATKSTNSFSRSGKTIRSPPTTSQPSQTTSVIADESMYQCDVCTITDKGDKVCCDSCNLWSHFACVNVTSDIANHDWSCRKCQQNKQEPLVALTSETGAASSTNATSNQESMGSSPNVTNVQSPATIHTVLAHQSQPVITEQTQNIEISLTSDVILSRACSHKSKSSTSSARRKALALQRLEEERKLEQELEKEEKKRREEDRKRRQLQNKQFLDKKYSILEQNSDESLSYDGYDDLLRQDRDEDIQHWRNNVPPSVHAEIPFVDEYATYNWEGLATGQSKSTPQMSSTNIFNTKENQVANPMDEPVPTLEDIGNNSAIDPIVSNTANSNTQKIHPCYVINAQSTQQNPVSIPRGIHNDKSKSMFQTTDTSTQPFSNKNQSLPSSFSQPLNSQVQSQTMVTSQQPTSTAVLVSLTQPVASNSFQLTNQQLQFPSNSQLSRVISSSTNNQTFGYATYVTSSVSNSATQPMNPSNDTTFVVDGQSSLFTNSNNRKGNQSTAYTYQLLMSSQSSAAALTQQPIMSSYQQSSMGHMPLMSNQSSIAAYQPYTSNPQPTVSMYQPVYHNQHLGATTHQTIQANRLGSSAYTTQQPGIAQAASTNVSSVPAANYQSNQSFNSTGAMNYSYAPQYYAAP